MAKTRVLIIDDDRIILDMLGTTLRRAGYDPLFAEDGDDGLGKFEAEKPDLVLIDIAMPGIDGYEVVERIRKMEGDTRKTPLVILTAHDQTVMRTYADELGADLYLTKPIKPKDLIQKLETLLTPSE